MKIGEVFWSDNDIRKSIHDFLMLNEKRPIRDNNGGMKSPHMFATWFLLKTIQPRFVIESGVWRGQSTWLIEKTLPDAKIYCIDPKLSRIQYKSPNATYFSKDFSKIDWSVIQNKENGLLFFDDHQNAMERVRIAKELGFKHLIFEDNYPDDVGDCYSLKKAFMGAGFQRKRTLKSYLIDVIRQSGSAGNVERNTTDASFLKEVLEIYYEFPPVFKSALTRWGADWTNEEYPTPPPLYTDLQYRDLGIFKDEAQFYTWLCYAKLK